MTTGRCLCGAVRFELRGAIRDVLFCHCVECRRWHGHVSASAAVPRHQLVVLAESELRWIASPRSDAGARRGFCGRCGSSLFWDPPAGELISVAAGALDAPTGLRGAAHWFTEQAGDYYDLPADGLPRHARSPDGPGIRPGQGPGGPPTPTGSGHRLADTNGPGHGGRRG
jgi:hypothetical protein